MRTAYLAWAGLGAAALFGASAVALQAVPVHGDKSQEKAYGGDRWEYAELHLFFVRGRAPALGAMPGGGGPGGPGGAPAPAVRRGATMKVTFSWVTTEGEVEADSWESLATKLKLPAPKKKASDPVHRLRVLNWLGAAGWELVGHQSGPGLLRLSSPVNTLTFKRKVVK
jgi:hypothetical protein